MRKAWIVLLGVFVWACDDPKSGGEPTASAIVSATPSAPTPSASAKPSASATATASVAPSASATTTVSATASVAPSDAGPSGPTCGKKPLPDCPLQGWMKKNMEPAMSSTDFPDLATQLDKTATFAPPGMPNWASISKDGAKAARAADLGGVKASCRGCHDQYKNKYKTEMRTRAVPG